MIQQLEETVAFLKSRGFKNLETGIVLGTGLGQLLDRMEIIKSISYKDIPNFPTATMEFHAGNLVLGKIEGKMIVAMQGRFHFYEGYSMKEITFPIRVLKMLGISKLLLSNAAGGINLDYKKGDLVIIEDHINLQTENPLTGANTESLGPRFPDMSAPYHRPTMDKLQKIAADNGGKLHEGVYASVTGPNLETRAEYRYLGIIGADMVGMSTVPEVIVANHMDLDCIAVSVITDECDPDNLKPVNIEEIIAVAGKADSKLSSMFVELIGAL